MMDASRIKQLIRWAEDQARDHAKSYDDIAAHRDVVESLVELLARRKIEDETP